MIELNEISKTYKGKNVYTEAIKNLSLKVNDGEFVAIMGRSGSGKTTLLNIIGCMDRFDSGSYYFDGEDILNFNSGQLAKFRNQNIGFVFQSFNLIPNLTSIENIELPLGLSNVKKEKRKERAYELLKEVGLEEKAHHKPSELSGGQQQRVAIARAIANHPKVLLADEPTGNLDEESGFQIMEFLKRLNKKEHITIIMVTHDILIAEYADYIVELRGGKIIAKA